MNLTNKYIPREYLALRINYCKQQLNELPDVKMHVHIVDGIIRKRLIVGKHKYLLETSLGQKYYKIKLIRDSIESDLKIYEEIWNRNFNGCPPEEFAPQKVIRTLYTNTGGPVVMNREFFDRLENDANRKYAKYKSNLFNGVYYRSAAERDIAIFYTGMGIPFKYEPEISIAGLAKPINPDFVLYIKELDNCKFHEHLGMKDFADYLRETKVKYGNYTGAGLVPDQDIIFTHDIEEVPFDIKYLNAKLNSAIYGTMICHEFSQTGNI